MALNLQTVFLKMFFGAVGLFVLLCLARRPLGRLPLPWGGVLAAAGDCASYLLAQLLLNLAFVGTYVLYVKNGYTPSLSDLGVAFTVVSVLAFFFLWRFGAFSKKAGFLFYPCAYTLFLLVRYLNSGTGVDFFGYLVFNPMFAFIGAESRGIGTVSVLLPLACCCLGRGLALKRIDKSGPLCHNQK